MIADFTARAVFSLGIILTVISVICVMTGGELIMEGHAVFVFSVLSIIILCRSVGWHIQFAILSHLFVLYRVLIFLVGAAFLFIICIQITDNRYAASLLLYCLFWAGKPARKHSGLNILLGGSILLISSSRVYHSLETEFILMFCLFCAGTVCMLYMLQKSTGNKKPGKGILWVEVIETVIVLTACLIIPLCISLAVSLPLTETFLIAKKQYSAFEKQVSADAGLDPELLIYMGIVAVLGIILFLVWKKMAERGSDNQTPVEKVLELFSRSRPLYLEKKRSRHFMDTYREKIIEYYYKFIDFLSSRGIEKEHYQTPEEFSEILNEKKIGDWKAAAALTRLFIIARFSNHPVGKEEYRECRHLLDTAQSSVVADV